LVEDKTFHVPAGTLELESNALPAGGIAIVIGSSGGIGSALHERLSTQSRFSAVLGLGRTSSPPLDLTDEPSIAGAARHVAGFGADVRLIIDASGILHGDGLSPEKSWRDLDATQMTRAFAVNAIGPALLMKHFLPLLPRQGRSVFATLSARVGSIGDNRLGGWYSYRASKAALNQFMAFNSENELRIRALPYVADLLGRVWLPGVGAGSFAEAYQIVDRIGIRTLRDPYSNKPYVEFYTTKRVGGDVVNFEAIKLIDFSQ